MEIILSKFFEILLIFAVATFGVGSFAYAHERPEPFASDFTPRNCSRDDDLKLYIIENFDIYYQGSDQEFLREPFSEFIRYLIERREHLTDINCKFSVTVYHVRENYNVIGLTELYYSIKYEIHKRRVRSCINRTVIYDYGSDLGEFYKPVSLCLREELPG